MCNVLYIVRTVFISYLCTLYICMVIVYICSHVELQFFLCWGCPLVLGLTQGVLDLTQSCPRSHPRCPRSHTQSCPRSHPGLIYCTLHYSICALRRFFEIYTPGVQQPSATIRCYHPGYSNHRLPSFIHPLISYPQLPSVYTHRVHLPTAIFDLYTHWSATFGLFTQDSATVPSVIYPKFSYPKLPSIYAPRRFIYPSFTPRAQLSFSYLRFIHPGFSYLSASFGLYTQGSAIPRLPSIYAPREFSYPSATPIEFSYPSATFGLYTQGQLPSAFLSLHTQGSATFGVYTQSSATLGYLWFLHPGFSYPKPWFLPIGSNAKTTNRLCNLSADSSIYWRYLLIFTQIYLYITMT